MESLPHAEDHATGPTPPRPDKRRPDGDSMTPALAARYGHTGRHKLGLSMASVTVAWRGANAVGAAGLSEPKGRLKVATGASPWSGMQQTTEPRQGRLNALIAPNIPRIMLNAVRIEECPKFLLETALSMVFLLTFDVSTYPRRHGLTYAERGGSVLRLEQSDENAEP